MPCEEVAQRNIQESRDLENSRSFHGLPCMPRRRGKVGFLGRHQLSVNVGELWSCGRSGDMVTERHKSKHVRRGYRT